jgi:hypothetical protein
MIQDVRNAHKILIGKPKRNGKLDVGGRIVVKYLVEIRCESIGWM